MNGVGPTHDQSKSLLSTDSPATNISGAGSTTPPSLQSSDSISPNSTQNLTCSTPNNSTAEANTPPEPNGTIGDPVEGKDDGQKVAQAKVRESASEGGDPQPSTHSVKAEETVLSSVNAQIELLEHTPDVVADDSLDWAPDGEHEMKRVKVSTLRLTSVSWIGMGRRWYTSISPPAVLVFQELCLSTYRYTN